MLEAIHIVILTTSLVTTIFGFFSMWLNLHYRDKNDMRDYEYEIKQHRNNKKRKNNKIRKKLKNV